MARQAASQKSLTRPLQPLAVCRLRRNPVCGLSAPERLAQATSATFQLTDSRRYAGGVCEVHFVLSRPAVPFAQQRGQTMHTLEERIQRLETSCRRWRLMTLAVAGLTVAHFAMRQPLAAQSESIPKEIMAETIACKTLKIQDGFDGKAIVRGLFLANPNGGQLSLYRDNATVEIGGIDVLYSEIGVKVEQGRDRLSMFADHLTFERVEPRAAELKRQMKEIFLEQRDFKDVKKPLEELLQAYKKGVHQTILLGTDKNPAGGGMLFINNAFGTDIVSAFTNKKNGGQLVISDADGKILQALPPGK